MVQGKDKFTFWVTPSVKAQMEEYYRKDNCKSQSEFVEKALCFYIGYLNAEDAADFLPRTFATTMRGLLGTYGDRMGSLLFKVAVEQNIANNLLAADMELDEATYQRLRGRCVQQVQSTNGRVNFQDAIQFQRKV